jgi:hypothetical protein
MNTRGIDICKDCHSTIHKLIDNKTLGLEYNTKELLLTHEGIAKFVKWVSNQDKKIKK